MDDYKQITKKTYNDIAADYIRRDESVIDETPEVSATLKDFCLKLPQHARALDIGSGGGRDSRYMFHNGFRVTCY